MPFQTNGIGHYNGIAGEKIILSQIGANPKLQTYLGGVKSACHLGGTANKADIRIARQTGQKLGVSVKTRSGNGGTFDWVNTTLARVAASLPSLDTALSPVREYYRSTKGIHRGSVITRSENEKEVKSLVAPYRAEYNRIANGCLNDITPAMLRVILSQAFEKYTQESDFYVAVHYPEKKSVWFEVNRELPLVGLLNNPNVSFFLKKNRSASQRIWCKLPNGSIHDTYLRLRVTLNNGMGAHLAGKKWSRNNSSVVSIKIQQDEPEKMLEQIKDAQTFVL